MPISPNFSSTYSQDWTIDFMQCAPNGYLKYTELCNIFQITGAEHSDSGGFSFTDMQKSDQAWVLSRVRVEVTKLPKWRDTVTVKTWIVRLEKSRSIRAVEMYLNGEKISGTETFWVVFNTQKRRPDMLALAHDHLEKFPDRNPTSENVKKIIVPDTTPKTYKRKVMLSDLDIVNHVNNVKYLEWCLDVMDSNIILEQKIDSFDMNFTKELLLNDEVTIEKYSLSDNNVVFSVSKDGISCFALEVNYK